MSFFNQVDLKDLWAVARLLSEANFDEASDEEKVDIYLERLSMRPLQKAFSYEKAKFLILEVIEQEIGSQPTKAM